jgi:anti-sigma-K factor RskA
MSGEDHKRWGEDLAAYMLGALRPDEREALERHLEGCKRCREELRWLEPAVNVLPETVERQEPPRQLRESLMAEVRADARRAESELPRAERRESRLAAWLRGIGLGGNGLRLAAGFAALVLVVAGVAGYMIGQDGSGGGAGGAETLEARQPNGITAMVVQEGDGGTLRLANVRDIPSDKVLEAWVQRNGKVEAVPALFVPDRHGQAETRIADMSGVEAVMVTTEPQGGSEAPTSKPIVEMAMPQ